MRSINVSLVSGGFETIATTMLAGLGWLASPEGQNVQQKVYDDLLNTYSDVETAWESVLVEEKSEYTVALYKEMLRYFAAMQLPPPRQTMKEFQWNGITIPKGVSVYMNVQAINHGKLCLYIWLFYTIASVHKPPKPLIQQQPKILLFIHIMMLNNSLTHWCLLYRQELLRRRRRHLQTGTLARREAAYRATLPFLFRGWFASLSSHCHLAQATLRLVFSIAAALQGSSRSRWIPPGRALH